MNLEFSDDQVALRDSMARLALDHASADGSHDRSLEFWEALKLNGWLGLPLPEVCGGVQESLSACGIVLEESGRQGLLTPFLGSAVVASRLLARTDPQARRRALYADLIAGARTLVLAHSEHGAFDPDSLATRLSATTAGLRLVGAKTAVVGAPGADALIVSALDDQDELVLVLVPCASPGVSSRPFHTRRGDFAADLALDCAVASDAVLATGPAAWTALRRTLQEGAICACWEALGLMRALLDLTISHVKAREQFGTALAELQVVRHRLAEMTVTYEEARALVRGATMRLEHQEDDRAASSAKVRVTEAARYVSRQAVQLHGAMGVTEESAVSALFKKLMGFEALHGTASEHLDRYSAAVLSSRAFVRSAVLPQELAVAS